MKCHRDARDMLNCFLLMLLKKLQSKLQQQHSKPDLETKSFMDLSIMQAKVCLIKDLTLTLLSQLILTVYIGWRRTLPAWLMPPTEESSMLGQELDQCLLERHLKMIKKTFGTIQTSPGNNSTQRFNPSKEAWTITKPTLYRKQQSTSTLKSRFPLIQVSPVAPLHQEWLTPLLLPTSVVTS